ncbi:zinc finger CCCH-type with G patch domain-containing protein-like isoform X2 [Photinus pyralis]|uniref:zinc finger CCCH-type with G patch domain-containing protein-like isoform X2 n=1 Tax=Photinus pyralis TaxID=7054 RepID=UPI0012671241|nr:zinc finger CCCH-type with G patch domain-containing protein-like isoform X2 [Photinus pyralis]XP_031338746.1 zinc finger CCCH-type with G patch domain-containing protein-like isoform X2 [Photinus pyralis]
MSEPTDILQAIETYKTQLAEVEQALTSTDETSQRVELQSLRDNIIQLIELTEETLQRSTIPQSNSKKNDSLENEFALFMAEMEKEGATNTSSNNKEDIESELKHLEGMKCKAPHKHNWGDVMYHNAIVCSVVLDEREHYSFDEIKVKIMFINPTHQEMLPCPYMMEGNCKFDDEQCKYSHGEIVLFSTLKEYSEPNFEVLSVGRIVLAKQMDKLWGRAKISKISEETCVVQFESSKKELKLQLHDVLPLDSESEEDISDDDDDYGERDDIINMSLLNTPTSQALGDWEKYTKGIGSKLMQKMGYVIGMGIGRYSDGRVEPVSAVVLPPGKSLDHCMNLREKAGGDKDLFSVEKKLKRLAKKQEKKNIKAYEREKNQVNVFNFLNETLASKSSAPTPSVSKSKHRKEIKLETCRSLNVASLKIDEDIKRTERDLCQIKESLGRNLDSNSQMHKHLKLKLNAKQRDLQTLKMKAVNIASEQSLRSDKKKMTVF